MMFNIDENLLKDFKKHAACNESSPDVLIDEYIRQGLINEKGRGNMSIAIINEDVMEKVNIKCKLTNKTPNEVINDVLWDCLRKIEDVPDEFDGERIWNMLEHDKPEGDDVLDRITDLF